MTVPRARLAALALGCVLAALALEGVRRGRRVWEHRAWEQRKRAAEALLAERARSGGAALDPAPREPASADVPAEGRSSYVLEPKTVDALFWRSESTEVHDPWTYYRHRPGMRLRVPWPEHPAGGWDYVTNAQGLREDHDVDLAADVPRIVVLGDSHADGFCDNRDAFANLLEADLRRRCGADDLEVVNAANGGFGPYQVLGAIEKYGAARPRAFVVALFPGNDFLDVRHPSAWFEGRAVEGATEAEGQELERGFAISSALMTQGLQSVLLARHHPEEHERLVPIVAGLVREMRDAAARADARLLVLAIPSPLDVPGAVEPEVAGRVRGELGLSEEELAANVRATEALARELRPHGIEVRDLRPALAASGRPCFWRKDFHLDLDGHRVVAAVLSELLSDCGLDGRR